MKGGDHQVKADSKINTNDHHGDHEHENSYSRVAWEKQFVKQTNSKINISASRDYFQNKRTLWKENDKVKFFVRFKVLDWKTYKPSLGEDMAFTE